MLMKLGVFENGEISDFQQETDMTLAHNTNARHVTDLVGLKATSILSPFFNTLDIGDTFIVPISHGE
jgi:phosphoribosylformylglycinamidine synthase